MKDTKGTSGYLTILKSKIDTIKKNNQNKEAESERINL